KARLEKTCLEKACLESFARGPAERSRAPAAPAVPPKSSAVFHNAPVWSAASTCLTLFRFGKRLGNGNSKNVAALRSGKNARKALRFPPGQVRTCSATQPMQLKER